MNIRPIVEGHGEVAALPVLLRRLVGEAQVSGVGIGTPIRRPRNQLTKEHKVKEAVRFALKSPDCGAVLVLLDGDSNCPAELGPRLQAWAEQAAGGAPCAVVIAHREYESWFLAAIESLRSHKRIRDDAATFPDPERRRDAKKQLATRMQSGKYEEKDDQPAFSARFSLSAAYRKSRSFRKLTDAFGFLVRSMGSSLDEWPPADWRRDV